MTPDEYAAWKRAHPKPHKPCRCCRRTNVTFPRFDNRCKDCLAEAQRRSRVRTGKSGVTMVGGGN